MIKFEAISRNVAAIALTIVASATMLIGAVGPAQVTPAQSNVEIARTVA